MSISEKHTEIVLREKYLPANLFSNCEFTQIYKMRTLSKLFKLSIDHYINNGTFDTECNRKTVARTIIIRDFQVMVKPAIECLTGKKFEISGPNVQKRIDEKISEHIGTFSSLKDLISDAKMAFDVSLLHKKNN